MKNMSTLQEPGTGKILLIDDDWELCDLVSEYLQAEGFQVELKHEGTGAAGLAASGNFQMVILDVMLPGINGFEVLRQLRSASGVPILMLTARGQDVDRIVGLELGADDYLPKPFNPRELTARVRAILRRGRLMDSASIRPRSPVQVGDIILDPSRRTVRQGGEAVELTAVEFDLAWVMLKGAGAVISREELCRVVLGREFSPLDRSIDMHVSHLRRKLGPHPDGSERIRSIRGVGYLYTAGLEE